jgi:succinoglycan biosynthesis protein ExoA
MTDDALPLITIIIPIGPGYSFSTVLDSIKKVDYPMDKIEIIVAEGKQPAKQRNEAIAVARGSILFFFDDDVILKPDIIKRMLAFYKNPEIFVVGGPNLTPDTDSFLQKCFGYVMSSFFATAQMSTRYKSAGREREATEKNLILCNLSGKADCFKENLFNETLYPAEENELFNRLQSKGCKFIYDPHSIVYHSRRPSLWKFAKQNFGYGRGRIEQLWLQPITFDPLFLTPMIFTFYLGALFYCLSVKSFPSGVTLIFSIPFLFYCGIDVAISFFTAISQRVIKSIFLVPFLFPLVHVSYGIGMIYGFFGCLFGKKKPPVKVELKHIDVSSPAR